MIWVIIIGVLLGFGFVVDFISKKRNIKIDPEEGAKNASESERIYVETHLHNIKKGNDTNEPL